MTLWDNAIEAVQWKPTRAYKSCPPEPKPLCATGTTRRLLVAMMFSFEVDMLQVALEQYRGIADVLLAESTTVHNVHEQKSKPLLWEKLQLQDRFSGYNVTSITCSLGRKKKPKETYDNDSDQGLCLSDAIRQRASAYDVVIVAATDEILGRSALMKLRHCALPHLPTSSAIGMPMGLLNRKFRSDWHYSNRPFSFSLPSIYPASYKGSFIRSHPPIGPVPVVGGMHVTNYCFLPYIVIKDLANADSQHMFTSEILCKRSIHYWKQRCYDMFIDRIEHKSSAETEKPCALSTVTFPSWIGEIDNRERHFWKRQCLQ